MFIIQTFEAEEDVDCRLVNEKTQLDEFMM